VEAVCAWGSLCGEGRVLMTRRCLKGAMCVEGARAPVCLLRGARTRLCAARARMETLVPAVACFMFDAAAGAAAQPPFRACPSSCRECISLSATLALEREFGWRGVSVTAFLSGAVQHMVCVCV
jgi:hypothetical protein